MLDCIKTDSFITLIPLDQIYSSKLSGYVDVGIDRASENYKEAIKILDDMNVPYDILVKHELRPGFVRLKINNISDINSIYITTKTKKLLNGKEIIQEEKVPLTDDQVEAVNKVYLLYSNDDNLRNQNIEIFKRKWNTYYNLNLLEIWWNNIHDGFTITPVGKVLAHANAQRCDPSLPPMN